VLCSLLVLPREIKMCVYAKLCWLLLHLKLLVLLTFLDTQFLLLLMQIWSTYECASMRGSQTILTSEVLRRLVRPGLTGWSRDVAKT